MPQDCPEKKSMALSPEPQHSPKSSIPLLEEEFKSSDRRLYAVIQAGLAPIAFLAPDGSPLVISQALFSLLGYNPSEFTAHSLFDLVHPDDIMHVRQQYDRLLADPGSRQNSIFRLRHATGSWLWTEASGMNMLNEPDIAAVVVSYRDITGPYEAEAESKESEEKYRHLFLNNPHPMWVYDRETLAILAVNDAAIQKYGYTRQEFLNLTIRDVRPPEDLPRFLEYLWQRQGELVESKGWKHRLKDGSTIEVEISSHLLEFEGRPAALILAQDVTERKQAEADRLRLLHAIEHSHNEVYIFDPVTLRFEYANASALHNLGFTLEELQARTPVDIKPEFTEVSFREWIAPLLSGEKEALTLTTVHRRSDLSTYPVEIHLQLDQQEDRSVFVAVILDITERRQMEAILHNTEQRYQRLLSGMMEGCQVIDYDWRYIYVNDAAALQGRRTPVELLMRTMMEVYPGIQDTVLFRVLRTCMDERVHRRMENRFEFPDGSIGWFELSIQPVPEGIFILSIDVTQRKLVETQLRESEEKYRSLFNNVPDGVYRSSPSGQLLDGNPALVRMLGYSSLEELQAINVGELYVDAEERRRLLKVASEQGELLNCEVQLRCRDGRQVVGLDNSRAIRDTAGEILYFEGTLTDITERKRAHQALQVSQEQLYSFIQQAPISIAMFDRQMYYLAASQRWIREYGGDRSDILGLSHYDVVPGLPEHWKDAHRRGIAGETVRNDDDLWLHEDGGQDWFRWAVVPWRHPDGEIGGIILSAENITENKQAEHRIRQQLDRITALREIDQVITSSFDLKLIANRIVLKIIEQLKADGAALLLFNQETATLTPLANHGLPEEATHRSEIRLGQELSGDVAWKRAITHYSDLEAVVTEIPGARHLVATGFQDYFGLPLISKGQVRGVLEIFHRSPQSARPEWLEFIETVAGQAAIAIDNIQLFDGLRRSNLELLHAYDSTIEGWSRALDLRDQRTEGHTQRVTQLTMELGRAFGLGALELANLRRGAMLHDIGKMAVPDAILQKPGPLTDEEWLVMKKHPLSAYQMLSPIGYLRNALDIPLYHHEKWDGTGYPKGLKGEQIPLPARLFAVVDIWDALRSDRPYRPAWSQDRVLEHIRSLSGNHLDPQVVHIFLESRIYELDEHSR
jgi:PAS domain S-box-containing protein